MRKTLATLICCAALASAQGPRRAPGFALPDIQMLTGHGGKFHDLADYRGKVVVLEFFKTTCPHCSAFADVLAQVAPKYGDKVAVLAVASLTTDTPVQVEQYRAGHKISYPVLLDQGQMMFSYVQSPNQIDLPRVYIVDPGGYIHDDFIYGLTTRDIFEGKGLFPELDKILGKK
ncbi:MAG TPA: TlpA disulfide reductase family protein [Bryobacteraceae bacterium]|nr:TlpA disulfide reductase family protein [Bryobacteraceae bacterium]